MKKVFSFLERFSYYAVCLFLIGLVLLLFLNILLRFVFKLPLHWTEEISMLLLVWMVYMAGASLQRKEKHIAVKLVHDRISPGARRATDIAGLLLTLFVLVLLVAAALKMVGVQHYSFTPSLSLRYSYFGAPVLLGAFLMLIHTAVSLGRRVLDMMEKKPSQVPLGKTI